MYGSFIVLSCLPETPCMYPFKINFGIQELSMCVPCGFRGRAPLVVPALICPSLIQETGATAKEANVGNAPHGVRASDTNMHQVGDAQSWILMDTSELHNNPGHQPRRRMRPGNWQPFTIHLWYSEGTAAWVLQFPDPQKAPTLLQPIGNLNVLQHRSA